MRYVGRIYADPSGTLLGDIPDNLRASDGSFYQGSEALQKEAARGYPSLPEAGALDQPILAQGFSGRPAANSVPGVYIRFYSASENSVALDSSQYPILTAGTPAPVSVPKPDAVFVPAVPAPVITSPPILTISKPLVGSGGGRQLEGIGEEPAGYYRSKFPYQNKPPSVTGNLYWYEKKAVINRGMPKFSNDAEEFLRYALIDSNWEDVERWLGWALANNMAINPNISQDVFLPFIDFGAYKFTVAPDGQRTYYPFSLQDYETFFQSLLKYASRTPVTGSCLRKKLELYRDAIRSSPRNQFSLRLSSCPIEADFVKGFLTFAGLVAFAVAVALTAGAASAAAGSVSSAAGAGAGAGAGTAATAGAAGAAAGGVGAGSIAAASVAPLIETVVVTAAAPVISAGTIAAGLTAGAIVASTAPAVFSTPTLSPVEAPIETVVVQASPIAPAPVLPPVLLATSLPVLEAAIPLPEFAEPQIPEIEDSIYDKVKAELKDLAAEIGGQKVQEYLQDKLTDKLQRQPTPEEKIAFEEYVDRLPAAPTAASNSVKTLAIVIGVVIALSLLSNRRK